MPIWVLCYILKVELRSLKIIDRSSSETPCGVVVRPVLVVPVSQPSHSVSSCRLYLYPGSTAGARPAGGPRSARVVPRGSQTADPGVYGPRFHFVTGLRQSLQLGPRDVLVLVVRPEVERCLQSQYIHLNSAVRYYYK